MLQKSRMQKFRFSAPRFRGTGTEFPQSWSGRTSEMVWSVFVEIFKPLASFWRPGKCAKNREAIFTRHKETRSSAPWAQTEQKNQKQHICAIMAIYSFARSTQFDQKFWTFQKHAKIPKKGTFFSKKKEFLLNISTFKLSQCATIGNQLWYVVVNVTPYVEARVTQSPSLSVNSLWLILGGMR